MGGKTLSDADPHVTIVWVFPFSAAAMEYTAFRPTCVTSAVGIVTTVIPVSSTLYYINIGLVMMLSFAYKEPSLPKKSVIFFLIALVAVAIERDCA